MPPLFNLIRIGVFVTVLLWTIIVLAISIHFQGILLTNDLTRFIPFAIFVCAATIVLLLALLLFGLRKANPISTRIELGCLGLDGVLWLVLAAFLITSDAENADVECFTSNSVSNQVPIEMPGFTTEIYQAQYRVLEAFSLFNVILILGFFLFLLFLALRLHSRGDRAVWTAPVTSVAWLYPRGYGNEKEAGLPPPVTAHVDKPPRKKGSGDSPKDMQRQKSTRAKHQDLGKIRTTGLTPPPKSRQPSYEYKHGYWLPKSADAPPAPPPPPKPKVSRSDTRDRDRGRDHTRTRSRSRDPHGRPGRDDRARSRRPSRERSLTRGNSGSNRTNTTRHHPPRTQKDPYYRSASPRR